MVSIVINNHNSDAFIKGGSCPSSFLFRREDISLATWRNVTSVRNSCNQMSIQLFSSIRTESVQLTTTYQIITKMTTPHQAFVQVVCIVSTKCVRLRQYWRSYGKWTMFLCIDSISELTSNWIFAAYYHPKEHIENEQMRLILRSDTIVTSSRKNFAYIMICYHVTTK